MTELKIENQKIALTVKIVTVDKEDDGSLMINIDNGNEGSTESITLSMQQAFFLSNFCQSCLESWAIENGRSLK